MRLSSNTQPAARRPPRPCRSHLHTLRILSTEWEQQSPLLICGFDITREAADALLFRRPKVGRLRTGHIIPTAGWLSMPCCSCAVQLCAGNAGHYCTSRVPTQAHVCAQCRLLPLRPRLHTYMA